MVVRQRAEVFIALGSNLGDRRKNILKAIKELARLKLSALRSKAIDFKNVSSFYYTRPARGSSGPNYINAVARIFTTLTPFELLKCCKRIEKKLGRKKSAKRGAPRPVDIDIIFYGDKVVSKKGILEIPHRSLCERDFVLKPISEIAPDKVHPVVGKTVEEILKKLKPSDKTMIRKIRRANFTNIKI